MSSYAMIRIVLLLCVWRLPSGPLREFPGNFRCAAEPAKSILLALSADWSRAASRSCHVENRWWFPYPWLRRVRVTGFGERIGSFRGGG